jgi:hypothetical protein
LRRVVDEHKSKKAICHCFRIWITVCDDFEVFLAIFGDRLMVSSLGEGWSGFGKKFVEESWNLWEWVETLSEASDSHKKKRKKNYTTSVPKKTFKKNKLSLLAVFFVCGKRQPPTNSG